jgi:hypothetical protein
MNETEVVQPTQRRRHSKEFKAQVIRAAMQPNVSIAAVALHYRHECQHAAKLGGRPGRTGCGSSGPEVDERAIGRVRVVTAGNDVARLSGLFRI